MALRLLVLVATDSQTIGIELPTVKSLAIVVGMESEPLVSGSQLEKI